MKTKKILTIVTMMLVLATAAFAKPVTVEYYEDLTFETDTDYLGKYIPNSYLLEHLATEMELNNVTITDIRKVDYKDTTDMRESDIAFFEEIVNRPYAEVWICFGSTAVGVWIVTEDKEVYYVEFVYK
jgi:hypothetical protein